MYRIERKYGKSIVDATGKQIAWVDDYNTAKKICCFLNDDGLKNCPFPKYVTIGDDAYILTKSEMYFCHKTMDTMEFTVMGGSLYTISSDFRKNNVVIKECSPSTWYKMNEGYHEE
jgi:hypothetical protein